MTRAMTPGSYWLATPVVMIQPARVISFRNRCVHRFGLAYSCSGLGPAVAGLAEKEGYLCAVPSALSRGVGF